jgi:two-component system sensor histidine kinase UhpB
MTFRPSPYGAGPAAPATIDDIPSGLALLVAISGAIAVLDWSGVPWQLGRGVMFATLWWFAPRSWGWLLLAPLLARVFGTALQHGADPAAWDAAGAWIAAALPRGLFIAVGPMLLHQRRVRLMDPLTFPSMALLLSAVGLSAVSLSVYEYTLLAPPGPANWPDVIVRVAGSGLLYVVGALMVTTMLAWLASAENRRGSGPILRAVATWLLPCLLVYLLVATLHPHVQLGDLLRRLLAVAVVLFSVRHGWRGGAVAMTLIALVLALELGLNGGQAPEFTVRLYLMITCVVALLFGATTDDLRQQASQLVVMHQEAERLAQELSVAARNNLLTEDRERRRLADDLHDEFGQTLTAMQTHLKLATPDLAASGRGDTAQILLRLAGTMRQQISGILESLRPAALDELGLFAAIDRGMVRRLAQDSGLVFETHLEGDARLLGRLDPSRRLAAYRMVQEAVTNVVRHAHATRCVVRIRANRRRRRLWVFIEVRDDGIGGVSDLQIGRGLIAMRDRIIALGGRLHVRNRHPGLRVHGLILQADIAPPADGEDEAPR